MKISTSITLEYYWDAPSSLRHHGGCRWPGANWRQAINNNPAEWVMLHNIHTINSLWPIAAIWRHRSWSSWLGWWLVAWWHQAMHCWANGDLSWAAEAASASAIFPVFNFGVGDIGLTLRWRHNGRDSVSNHQLTIVYSNADHRKHQSSASLAFVRGIHRGPVNSPHKWPVTRKMFPFDDVIMKIEWQTSMSKS